MASDKDLALKALRTTLKDKDARDADRVRAAQLLLEHDSTAVKESTALGLSDDELLKIARGAPETPEELEPWM